jgi:hypothetical protein
MTDDNEQKPEHEGVVTLHDNPLEKRRREIAQRMDEIRRLQKQQTEEFSKLWIEDQQLERAEKTLKKYR